MGTYVVLKTARVMCWKFEFLNEVYNTMALTLAEQLRVPKGFTPYGSNAILKLLRLPVERVKDFVPVTFGDRAPEPEGNDPATTRAKYERNTHNPNRDFFNLSYIFQEANCAPGTSNGLCQVFNRKVLFVAPDFAILFGPRASFRVHLQCSQGN